MSLSFEQSQTLRLRLKAVEEEFGRVVLTVDQAMRVFLRLEGIARLYGLPERDWKEEPALTHFLYAAVKYYNYYSRPVEQSMRQILPPDFVDFPGGQQRTEWWTPEPRLQDFQDFLIRERTVVAFHKLLVTPRTTEFNPQIELQFQVRDVRQPVLNLLVYPHPRNPDLYVGDLATPIVMGEEEMFGLKAVASPCVIAPVGVAFTPQPYEWQPITYEAPQTVPQAELARSVEQLQASVKNLDRRIQDLEKESGISPRTRGVAESIKDQEK